ncbi:MAG: hypothetical protein JSV57_04960 [Candidatus Bathyarchaeota archaeon]|nr:MAG: hypothetical protein JSV57_04960 [Candidatus Bathyarchaeota archaeon]
MSETPAGLGIAEKFFGLIVLIIGALTVYYTYLSPPDLPPGVPSVGGFISIFIIAGFLLIAVGIFLMIAKAE